jgi:hypothetical protein
MRSPFSCGLSVRVSRAFRDRSTYRRILRASPGSAGDLRVYEASATWQTLHRDVYRHHRGRVDRSTASCGIVQHVGDCEFGIFGRRSETSVATQGYGILAQCSLTLVEADVRSNEARYARVLFDSPAA